MKLSVLSIFLLASTSAYAATCQNPIQRKEWRTLNALEQFSYLAAVRCLQFLPAKSHSTIPGAVTRFDDFQGNHILQTDHIHFVGHFQPWHRYFLATYEKALREECGYWGAQPYWDWTQDAADITKAPVLSSPLGFGGNGLPDTTGPLAAPFDIPGRTGGGCITDGPFASPYFTLHVGPGNSTARGNYCLRRDFAPPVFRNALNATVVNNTLAQPNFQAFDIMVQGGITPSTFTTHAGGHLGVGGEYGTIADVYSSPGDPLFYLHHANLDRNWWRWQSQNLTARLTDISGPVSQFGPPFGDAPNTQNVTLSFPIGLGLLAPTITVGDVMNIQGNTLCYTYV